MRETLTILDAEKTEEEYFVEKDGNRQRKVESHRCNFCSNTGRTMIGYFYGGGWTGICLNCLSEVKEKETEIDPREEQVIGEDLE